MAEYDWIETEDFERAIRSRIQQRLVEADVEGYSYTFAGKLAKIARENRPTYEDRAKHGAPVFRLDQVLTSVDFLIDTSISIARSDKRATVREHDVERAIEMHFCQIWPFCK